MASPLRKPDWLDDPNLQTEQPAYHDYQDDQLPGKWQDLIFFAKIACFGISTVLFSFIFLTLNFPTILAFIVALAFGAAITYGVTRFLSEHFSDTDNH